MDELQKKGKHRQVFRRKQLMPGRAGYTLLFTTARLADVAHKNNRDSNIFRVA